MLFGFAGPPLLSLHPPPACYKRRRLASRLTAAAAAAAAAAGRERAHCGLVTRFSPSCCAGRAGCRADID